MVSHLLYYQLALLDSTGFLRKCRFRLFSCGGAQALPAWTI